MANHREPAVEFRNVAYRPNGSSEILHDLNLIVDSGETLVLLGRSGSGKTTSLKLINNLLSPTAGEVIVQARSTQNWDVIRLRRQIGYVIQDIGLFPHFTVERNITLIPRLEGWSRTRIDARFQELMLLVGLDPHLTRRYPRELSGGQRQRVGVARALAADPPILLMDEPFGALDPITRADLQNEFAALQKRLRKTVVFVTHDVREALLLSDRIALMEGGRLIALCTPQEFLRSRDPLVAAYVKSIGTDLDDALGAKQ
ncbi:MAG TPA: ATP-binding cassette domain-containing protein [Terriglobales bacterium]|nr:ATP-binding cassette domain-containing protein [Terriglobales bacterium]